MPQRTLNKDNLTMLKKVWKSKLAFKGFYDKIFETIFFKRLKNLYFFSNLFFNVVLEIGTTIERLV